MKAVILAAGDGDRLEPLSKMLPKAMLPIGQETVVSRLLRQLHECGVTDVCVVVGYDREQLERHVRAVAERLDLRVQTAVNRDFESTSTGFSALLSKPFALGEPFVLVDGDLVVSDQVMSAVVGATCTTVAYEARGLTGPEEMKIAVREENGRELVARLSKHLDAEVTSGESIGLAHFESERSRDFFAALSRLPENVRASCYYEQAIDDLASRVAIDTFRVDRAQWIEIDFVTDYLQAVERFGPGMTPPPKISEQVLLCPGPVRVSPGVRQALLHADIGHRESEFVEILSRTRQKLLQVCGVGAGLGYTDVILSGSGTAANEAVVSSYLTGKRTLVLTNGEFGDRIAELCRRHEVDLSVGNFGWTRPYRLETIEAALAREAFDAVFMVHHETSTGMLNPLGDVAGLCSRYGAALCVDTISSLGAEELRLDTADIALFTGCSNKALAALPGLSFVCGKTEVFESLAERRPRTSYLDLFRYFEAEERSYQTPNTPAVPLFFALESALDELLTETLDRRLAKYDMLATIVRRGLGELGWETVLPPETMSRVLTTFYYPPMIEPEAFHDWVRRHNYVVYRGKGPLFGRAFQVANIGWLHRYEIERFVEIVAAFEGAGRERVLAG